MRYPLLLTVLFLSYQCLYSQTEKKVTAAVVCNDFALQGIEIVNLIRKNTARSNDTGKFSIFAKVGDQLMFISKNYEYKTITIKEADFQNANFTITLVQKPEELDEVVIASKVKAPFIPNMQKLLDTLYADDKYSQKKNPLIDNGSIMYGPDIIRIVGKLFRLFAKEKEKTKEAPEIKFKDLVNSSLDLAFFKKTLQLKPEEIELFLDFCDADSKSKKLIENANELALMDFLLIKNIEFKKRE